MYYWKKEDPNLSITGDREWIAMTLVQTNQNSFPSPGIRALPP